MFFSRTDSPGAKEPCGGVSPGHSHRRRGPGAGLPSCDNESLCNLVHDSCRGDGGSWNTTSTPLSRRRFELRPLFDATTIPDRVPSPFSGKISALTSQCSFDPLVVVPGSSVTIGHSLRTTTHPSLQSRDTHSLEVPRTGRWTGRWSLRVSKYSERGRVRGDGESLSLPSLFTVPSG